MCQHRRCSGGSRVRLERSRADRSIGGVSRVPKSLWAGGPVGRHAGTAPVSDNQPVTVTDPRADVDDELGAERSPLFAPIALVLALSALSVGGALTSPKFAAVAAAGILFVAVYFAPRERVWGLLAVGFVASLTLFPVLAMKGVSLSIIGAAVVVMLIRAGVGERRCVTAPASTFAFWVALAAVGMCTGLNPESSARAWFFFALVVFVLVPTVAAASREDMTTMYAGGVTLVAVELALSLYEEFVTRTPLYVIGSLRDPLDPEAVPAFLQSTLFEDAVRVTGTLGHPLPLSFLMVVMFAITVAFADRIPVAVRRSMYVACLGALLLASARSALIAVVLVAVIAGLARRTVPTLIAAVFGVVAYVLIGGETIAGWLGVDALEASGSFTHRSGVLSALPALLDRDLGPLIVGTGYDQQKGVIETFVGTSFSAVDNQFVGYLITGGLVAFVALIVALLVAAVQSQRMRLPLLAVVVMFFSFDALSWLAPLSLVAVIIGLAANPATDDEVYVEDPV
ncbi:hypothetical protein ACXVUM_03480 [Williamsia sp. SKLECPSW1]